MTGVNILLKLSSNCFKISYLELAPELRNGVFSFRINFQLPLVSIQLVVEKFVYQSEVWNLLKNVREHDYVGRFGHVSAINFAAFANVLNSLES